MVKDIITVSDVSYTYPNSNTLALKNISFKLPQGSWTAIIGHNGSGKSTLAKLLDGLILPDNEKGQIIVDDHKINSNENIWKIRNIMGIVFQNPDNQFVGATVEDDIAFGLENRNVDINTMKQRVNQALKEVGMTGYRKKEPQTLSGGQKQRVAIAGILALEPKIIILDESTSMLDPEGREQILTLIQKLQKEKGLTVISITHDVNEIMLADQVLVLDNGKLLAQATADKIFNSSELLATTKIGRPFLYQLKYALIKQKIEVPVEINTEEKLVDYLWQLNSKM